MTSSSARRWSGGALAALTVATGLLVGLRSIGRVELPRLHLLLGAEPMPREALGVEWSTHALWPAELQAAALNHLLGLTVSVVLAVTVVATLNAIMSLAESASSRRGELATRAALGATPVRLTWMLLRELRTLVMVGLALGLVLGVAAGGLARALWPGSLLELGGPGTWADAILALSFLVFVVAAAYAAGGWRAARGTVASISRAGARTAADPKAVFVRKALAAAHVALTATILVGLLALSSALEQVGSVPSGARDTVTIAGTSPAEGGWRLLLRDLAGAPGLEAESLATPGAVLGLGVRDLVTAECGDCYVGGLPVPFLVASADHHAVSADYFELAGVPLLRGRSFSGGDASGSDPVAIVSRTFAASSFEDGDPLGKRVRLGTGLDDWYTVVGVVEDSRVPVLGGEDVPRAAVYLNARERSPRAGLLLLRGSSDAIDRARALMRGRGFLPAEPRSLEAHRVAAGAALRWAYRVVVALGALAFLTALHGVYATALQTTRRRAPELALRRAVGATSAQIGRHVLAERLRITAWGLAGFVFLATMAVAILTRVAGVHPVEPGAYAAVAGISLVAAISASTRALTEALDVEPGTVLE